MLCCGASGGCEAHRAFLGKTNVEFLLTSTGVLHHQVERPVRLDDFKKFDYRKGERQRERGRESCAINNIMKDMTEDSWTQKREKRGGEVES